MISDEPAPTTMPPANNSAAKTFVFMLATSPIKLKKKKGGPKAAPHSKPLLYFDAFSSRS
jgi:hypothetical protein